MRVLEFGYTLDVFVSRGRPGRKMRDLQPIFDCALREKRSMSAQAVTGME